jgi:hypothetical protein
MASTDLDLSLLLEAPVLTPPTAVPDSYERARELAADSASRVVRLCPHRDGYPLVDWVLSPLPELCEREGLALVLDFDPAPVPWADVVRFARTFPAVPMLVLGVDLEADRAAPAALDATANVVLHVEDVPELAPLIETFGAHRFVGPHGETAATLVSGEWGSMNL